MLALLAVVRRFAEFWMPNSQFHTDHLICQRGTVIRVRYMHKRSLIQAVYVHCMLLTPLIECHHSSISSLLIFENFGSTCPASDSKTTVLKFSPKCAFCWDWSIGGVRIFTENVYFVEFPLPEICYDFWGKVLLLMLFVISIRTEPSHQILLRIIQIRTYHPIVRLRIVSSEIVFEQFTQA